MTGEEVDERLEHILMLAVTDGEGAAVVLKPQARQSDQRLVLFHELDDGHSRAPTP